MKDVPAILLALAIGIILAILLNFLLVVWLGD